MKTFIYNNRFGSFNSIFGEIIVSLYQHIKIIIDGSASGKSTIKSVVFEGKDPKEFLDNAYSATINYQREINYSTFTGEKDPLLKLMDE